MSGRLSNCFKKPLLRVCLCSFLCLLQSTVAVKDEAYKFPLTHLNINYQRHVYLHATKHILWALADIDKKTPLSSKWKISFRLCLESLQDYQKIESLKRIRLLHSPSIWCHLHKSVMYSNSSIPFLFYTPPVTIVEPTCSYCQSLLFFTLSFNKCVFRLGEKASS